MPFALSAFEPEKLNTDFTPSSNYAVNEAKNSALMAEYGRKSEAQKRLSGRMQDVQTAIQNHDIMNQGVVDLMEVNPELYKSISDAVQQRDKMAADKASKTADFMAGAVPYVAHAEERGQTKQQAWDDYKGFAQQSGIPLGQFAEMPYSDNALAMLKSSIYGIKGVLEGGASLQEENGALVTRTPLGDVKDVKVLPQEKSDKAVPLYDKSGKPITVKVPGTNEVKIKMSDGSLASGGSVPAPEKAGKPQLVTTYNDQGNPQYELVEPGRMPVGKPAAKPSPAMQASEDERKAAGWVAQARNSLQNMRAVLSRNPSAADQGLLEAIAPESLANIFRSSDRQVFTQAASSFAEAALRAATGAGVNRDEAAQKIRELTPVFGDKPEVKLNKLQSMDVYLSSLESRAGRALSNSQSSVRQPVQVKSTAEYNALPSGAIFIDPNGVKRRKP